METTPDTAAIPALWTHSPAMETFWRGAGAVVSFFLTCAAGVLSMMSSLQVVPASGSLAVLVAFVVLVAWVIASVAIHEAGHFVGARRGGATVIGINVLRLQGQPTHRGWRWRWTPRAAAHDGAVIAIPTLDRPFREQMLPFVAGGPVASAVAGLVFAAAWAGLGPTAAGLACGAGALINAMHAIVNLMPTRRHAASDGMNLLIWAHDPPADNPHLAFLRLQAMSLSGITADRVPEEAIAPLEHGPVALPLFVSWMRLKAHQNRGEWREAAALQPEIAARLEPFKGEHGMSTLRWIFAAELAFSEAMAGQGPSALRALVLDAGDAWSTPHLWPRCQALLAAIDGDVVQREGWLAESWAQATASLDRALPASEAGIHAAVRGVFGPA